MVALDSELSARGHGAQGARWDGGLYTLGSVFVILPIALLAAMMLNSKIVGKRAGFASAIFFIPSVTSVIVADIIFRLLLKTNDGPINYLLKSVGLISESIQFLSDPNWAIPSLVLIGIWRYFGVNSLYFLSAWSAWRKIGLDWA
jgi:ABC-type sugar transport system permease subunit